MTYIAYLDEYGHIGPFVSRRDKQYHESPVFGLAGLVLPINQVRNFATWFYQRKQELLAFEIKRSGKHAATWEKKGSALYTLTNVEKYRELRVFTNRFLNKITGLGGHVFFVGVQKTAAPADHDPNSLYVSILRETIKRLDQFCAEDCKPQENFLLVLDEHDQREALITAASQAMFNPAAPRRCLIEPPFQVESHRYQTLQAADWLAGLVGRIGACWAEPDQYKDWTPIRTYFEARVNQAAIRSGIRTGAHAAATDATDAAIVAQALGKQAE